MVRLICLFIDGYTQYECSGSQPIKGIKSTGISQDLEIVNFISQKLLPHSNTRVVNLVGQTYRKTNNVSLLTFSSQMLEQVSQLLIAFEKIQASYILTKSIVFLTGINNTIVKLVNKSLVNDVGNLFTKGKNTGAKSAGFGFIS